MSEKTLAAALAAAQGALQAPKKTGRAQLRGRGSAPYEYATIADLLDVVRPALSAAGVAFSQIPTIDGDLVVLRTRVWVGDGQGPNAIESIFPLWSVAKPPGHHEQGSALTYARRYCLEAILGLAGTPDDDGHTAQDGPDRRRQDPTPRPPDRRPQPPAPQRPAGVNTAAIAAAAASPSLRVVESDESEGLSVAQWVAAIRGADLDPWLVAWGLSRARIVDGKTVKIREITPTQRAECVRWLLEEDGWQELLTAIEPIVLQERSNHRRTWFAKIRGLDIATDDERHEIQRAIYGCDSLADVPLRALIEGDWSTGMLRAMTLDSFKRLVDAAQGATGRGEVERG